MNHWLVYFLVIASSATEDVHGERQSTDHRPRIGFEGLVYFIYHNNA